MSAGTNKGGALAALGAKRAYDHALEEWKENARAALQRASCLNAELTSDDVWAQLDRWKVAMPREGRAMAGVMGHGKREGWIVPSDPPRRRPSNRPVHHVFPCLIWVSLVHGLMVPVPNVPPVPPRVEVVRLPLPREPVQLDLMAEVQRMAGL